MDKSLFKKFEKTYLELQIFLEKAKTWDINEEQRKQIEERVKSTTESYHKVKEKYEKESQWANGEKAKLMSIKNRLNFLKNIALMYLMYFALCRKV